MMVLIVHNYHYVDTCCIVFETLICKTFEKNRKLLVGFQYSLIVVNQLANS